MVDIPGDVKKVLEERGIDPKDISSVVEGAESSGVKLVSGPKSLAKKQCGDVVCYALYEGDKVTAGWSHKLKEMDIKHVVEEETQEWTCNKCGGGTVRGNIDLEYLGVTRLAPAVVCPKCMEAYIEEDIAAKTLVVAAMLLEKKAG
jgi:hypothetical protein